MSAAASAIGGHRRTGTTSVSTALLAGAGVALLLLRARVFTLPDPQRVGALAAIFVAVGALALVAPAARGPRRLHPAAAFGIGLAGLALARAAAGPPPAWPAGTWAIPLGIAAAVSEELVFRRAAYAGLARRSEALAVVGTAVAFGLIHVPLYGMAALPVDIGAGLLLSWQRWATGSWGVPATTHATANILAVIR